MNKSNRFYRFKESLNIHSRAGHVQLVPLICILLITTACGGSNAVVGEGARPNGATTAASAPQTASINICALVTKADAENVLGAPVKDTEKDGSGGCEYKIADEKGGMRIGVLSVSVETDGKTAFDMHRKMSGVAENLLDVAIKDESSDASREETERQTGGRTRWLSGVGDKAYMSGGFGGGMMNAPMVSAVKGDVWILVQAFSNSGGGSEDALKAVAGKVADAF